MEDQMDNEYVKMNPAPEVKPANSMAIASLVLGILSLVSCCTMIGAFPLGGLAVIFALLSRTGERMDNLAIAGIICGLLGILLTVAVWIFFVGMSLSTLNQAPFAPNFSELENLMMIWFNVPIGGGR